MLRNPLIKERCMYIMLILSLLIILIIVAIIWGGYLNKRTSIDTKTHKQNFGQTVNMEAAAENFHPIEERQEAFLNHKIIPIANRNINQTKNYNELKKETQIELQKKPDEIQNIKKMLKQVQVSLQIHEEIHKEFQQLKKQNQKILQVNQDMLNKIIQKNTSEVSIKKEIQSVSQKNLDEFQSLHIKMLEQIQEISEEVKSDKKVALKIHEEIHEEFQLLQKQNQKILQVNQEMKNKIQKNTKEIPKSTSIKDLSLDQQLMKIEMTENQIQIDLFNELTKQLDEAQNGIEQIITHLNVVDLLNHIEAEFMNTYNQYSNS